MKATRLDEQHGRRTFVVVFDSGDEAKAGLTTFAHEQHIAGAQLTAVGGFSRAVLGYFDRERKEYLKIPVEEQVEVLSLLGDVALTPDAQPEVHAHVVVGRRDGTTLGGHLLEGSVWPTLEVVVTDAPRHLQKVHNAETGLALINPGASAQVESTT